MTTEALTCPYCNASIGVAAGLSPGQRIICPRCGDTFSLRFVDAITGQPHTLPASETAVTANVPPTRTRAAAEVALPSRRSNRLIAGAVIAVMLFMAGGGLIFMLMTQQQRRGYDTNRPPRRPGKQRGVAEPETPPVVASVSPDKLAGLGYLPSGTNFLFAARVPELLAGSAGRRLLHEPIKLGQKAYPLETVPAWLGFHLEDIDHLVLGARIDDSLIPPFYVVFRTVQPYDEEQLRQRLKATRVASPSKKALYAFQPRSDLPLCAWFADERTVVLALFSDQLERLSGQPVEGLEQLPEELRAVLKKRREPASPVWIAGHSRDWSKTSASKLLGGVKRDNLTKLAALNTFGIWVVPNGTLTIKGVFGCKDEKGASGLEESFRSLGGPDPGFKTVRDGPWLLLQFQTAPDFLSRVLKR